MTEAVMISLPTSVRHKNTACFRVSVMLITVTSVHGWAYSGECAPGLGLQWRMCPMAGLTVGECAPGLTGVAQPVVRDWRRLGLAL